MRNFSKRVKAGMKGILVIAAVVIGILSFSNTGKASEESQAEKIASYALSQVGTRERRSDSDDIFYNDWYYGRAVSNRRSGEYSWCHVFVSYCANKCGISTSVIPKTANCQSGVTWFKNSGRYHTRTSGYTPVVGDIVYLSTDGTATAHHVGIVYAVDNSYIYYVDGNNTTTSPHGVAKSKKARNNSAILGYGNPAYTSSGSTVSKPVKTYSIDNVKIASIDANQVTITWSTTNLPRCVMVVNAGNKSWRSSYAVGNTSITTNTFSATFNRSNLTNCPDTVNILLYGYSTASGAGANETLHRVTYNSSTTGQLVFPSKPDLYYSDSVPVNMISHGQFAGWVISDAASISKVTITVNGTPINAQIVTRSDVSKVYSGYKYIKGYTLTISPYYVRNGLNSYSVVVSLSNGKTYTIKSGTFKAEKVNCIYDDDFFKMHYASNSYVSKLKTAADREKFFYDNLNNKFSDGYTKDYLCGSMVCDLGYYYSANADLKKRGWNGWQIYEHFLHYGLKASGGKEYRAVSPWVSLNYLHNTYPDLKSMTPEQLIIWAATYGAKIDQRLLSNTNAAKAYRNFYQCTQYASLNKDLVKAYSKPELTPDLKKTSCNKYWFHLWNYGISEGRRTSNNFNVSTYCKNSGLPSNTSPWGVFYHYCNIGYAKKIKTK